MQGKAPKKIHAILTETLGEHAPSYDTFKNWVTQFKRGGFSTFFPLVGPRTYQHHGINVTSCFHY
jgi:hypothetical protein